MMKQYIWRLQYRANATQHLIRLCIIQKGPTDFQRLRNFEAL
jgi:hypothetical protein